MASLRIDVAFVQEDSYEVVILLSGKICQNKGPHQQLALAYCVEQENLLT